MDVIYDKFNAAPGTTAYRDNYSLIKQFDWNVNARQANSAPSIKIDNVVEDVISCTGTPTDTSKKTFTVNLLIDAPFAQSKSPRRPASMRAKPPATT